MFSPEQKSQLLANLDIEVAHRSRQLESWLSDTLAAFRNRHESQLAYIPHVVRGMTMAEFDEKYDGDVQAALRGIQKERIAIKVAPLDRNEMKRKWAPVPEEEEPEACLGDSGKNLDNHTRAAKHLRVAPPSPQKKPPPFPGNNVPSRIHAPRTPGTSRLTAQSPSPRKLARIPSAPLQRAGTAPALASPTKPTAASLARQVVRVPSTSTFKPAIPPPPKTPTYPPVPRWPRKDENMLSLNGSPLTNPYELGLEWLAEEDAGEGGGSDVPARTTLRRTASHIIIRRDPSSVLGSDNNTSNGLNHHRQIERSRSNSNFQPQTQTQPVRSDSHPLIATASNPVHMAARVAVPTRDGHLLEFDPLLTSPGALDKLEGITNSAKKQAKEDMSKLVQAAVAKWTVK